MPKDYRVAVLASNPPQYRAEGSLRCGPVRNHRRTAEEDVRLLESGVPELPDEDETKIFTKVRTDLPCPDCAERGEQVMLVFRSRSKFGPFYGCPRFPTCKASHGAHPDGAPLGTPAGAATKAARIEAHAWFDKLWKGGLMKRTAAYAWMREAMGMTADQAHIGHFDVATCSKLIELVKVRLEQKLVGE